jgi:hypothetical protein
MHPRNLRLKAEQGFTTVVAMGMLLVGMLLVAAAFAASDGDTSSARHDQYYKEAYNAAEAGINWYMFHLTQDANYWGKCASASPSNSPPVYQKNPGSFTWTTIPGSEAKYMIELLPAAGQTSCAVGVSTSMIDPATGAFKIRSTGLYRGVKRTLVATFRRVGFLNFLYFTDFETMDPATYGDATAQQTAQTNCAHYYYVSARPGTCNDPAFISSDTISGPLHTNDEMLTCGSPTFGQKATDRVESSSPQPSTHPGYRQDTSCSGNPNFVGIFKAPASTLTLPPSNQELQNQADSTYIFTGTTHIQLGTPAAGQMTVTTASGTSTMSMPPKGIIYVQNGDCSPYYDSTMDYPAVADGTGCGDVYVRGAVSSDLTIGADNDIIIDGNLTHGSGVELGLIANNFVRVYHPCTTGTNQTTSPEDPGRGAMNNPTINAAILAINHSFIVDNWACGNGLGTLTVYGAIAQKYRGPVGTHSGSTVTSGYSKGYSYDYELRYHQPPYFLDPVQAGWGILQQTEQVPPAH